MASFVQAKRDLGCKACQVTVLEEGVNADGKWAKDFWSLLGGKSQYPGVRRRQSKSFPSRLISTMAKQNGNDGQRGAAQEQESHSVKSVAKEMIEMDKSK